MAEKEPLKLKGSMDEVLKILLNTPPKKASSSKKAAPKKALKKDK